MRPCLNQDHINDLFVPLQHWWLALVFIFDGGLERRATLGRKTERGRLNVENIFIVLQMSMLSGEARVGHFYSIPSKIGTPLNLPGFKPRVLKLS